jgi:hypothetical protein
MKAPKHLRDLDAAGFDYDLLQRAIAFFAARGVNCGYSTRRRLWFFWRWQAGDAPVQQFIWCALGAFTEYLDAPSSVFAELDRFPQLS